MRVFFLFRNTFLINSSPYDSNAWFIYDSTNLIAVGINNAIIDKREHKKCPYFTIIDSWVFDDFILAGKAFVKALEILKTCESVNDNLCEKLASSLEPPTTVDEWFKVTWAPLFSVRNPAS